MSRGCAQPIENDGARTNKLISGNLSETNVIRRSYSASVVIVETTRLVAAKTRNFD